MAGPFSITTGDAGNSETLTLEGADPSESIITNLERSSDADGGFNVLHGESFQINPSGGRYTYRWTKDMTESSSDSNNIVEHGDIANNIGRISFGGETLGNAPIGNIRIDSIVHDSIGTESIYRSTDGNNLLFRPDAYTQSVELDFGVHNGFNFDTSGTTNGNMQITVGSDGNIQMLSSGWANAQPQFYRPGRQVLRMAEGPEEKARGLLRRMVGEQAFRGYIRNGFISYRAKSGKIYQIFPGWGHSKVWKDGQPIEQLCVIFQDGNLPPTDSIIMRLLMLEHDEEGFRQMSNISGFNPSRERYTEPVIEPGRILRMAEAKKNGTVLQPFGTGGCFTAGDTGDFTIRVA